jgi:hypothetical protein
MIKLEVDEKRYLSDALDGETIVMDMLQGRLFLLEAGAAVLWDRLLKGDTRETLMQAIESHYGSIVHAEAETFLNRLIALGLVSETNGDSVPLTDIAGLTWPTELGELALTEYDDMTSIITMDPIHDVDPSQGWPFKSRQ